MRITATGQVTIPTDIREKAGLFPDTDVECVLEGDSVRIVRVEVRHPRGRASQITAHLRGRGDQPFSTDAIMALTREGAPLPDF